MLAALIALLIAGRVIAASIKPKQTQTDPEVPYKEITYKPAQFAPFPVGKPPSTPEPVKTPPAASVSVTEPTGDALQELLRRESGNNPLAVNSSSGACGLGQSLPCSKMLNWIGVATLEEATYDKQLAWMMMYITGRYGTPEDALAFHNSHGWY